MYYVLSVEYSDFFGKPVPSVLFAEEDLLSVSYDLHTLGVEVSIPDLEQRFSTVKKRGLTEVEGYFVEFVAPAGA